MSKSLPVLLLLRTYVSIVYTKTPRGSEIGDLIPGHMAGLTEHRDSFGGSDGTVDRLLVRSRRIHWTRIASIYCIRP